MTFDKRFYGIYMGICVDNQDPENNQRIQLIVPQVLGQETTQWADPCLPVIFNADHPDHIAHTAAQVAALLNTHTDTYTTTGTTISTFGSHTHGVTLASAHTGNSGTLTHPHKTAVDAPKKWNASSGTAFNDATDTKEHSPHRGVPNLDQKVWVMFIAGDPNFPVWMGVLQ